MMEKISKSSQNTLTMNNGLQSVVLKKTDTCLTYVYRRLGKPELCEDVDYESLHEHFDSRVYNKKSSSNLKIGDILLWDREVEYQDISWVIDKKGVICWKRIPTKFHIGIYEGDDLFTDCTRTMIPPHPSIRMRKLSDIKKLPDQILTLSTKE